MSKPVNGEPATSIITGETVSEASVPISNLTFVVCPCGFTDPFMSVICFSNGDKSVTTVGGIPGAIKVLKLATGEVTEPEEFIAINLK